MANLLKTSGCIIRPPLSSISTLHITSNLNTSLAFTYPAPKPSITPLISASMSESASESESNNKSGDDVLVQYVVLRRDLIDTWPMGSVVTQGCHAAVAAIWSHKDDPFTLQYCSPQNIDFMHKVSLEVKGETQMLNLSEKLKLGGIAHKLWIEQPENIPTCIATKPYPKSTVSSFFKKLKLCKDHIPKTTVTVKSLEDTISAWISEFLQVLNEVKVGCFGKGNVEMFLSRTLTPVQSPLLRILLDCSHITICSVPRESAPIVNFSVEGSVPDDHEMKTPNSPGKVSTFAPIYGKNVSVGSLKLCQ